MSRLELIEFVAATPTRAVGTRLRVDPGSATSFCDVQKVAVRVGEDRPAPAPEPDVDDVDDEFDDADLDD